MTSNQDDLTLALSRYLTSRTQHVVQVRNLVRLSEGWETDVYGFDALGWRGGRRVLRLFFGEGAGSTALHEYASMELLARAGYPVPAVELVEADNAALGRAFIIMEQVDGAPLTKRLRESEPAVREQSLDQFCQLLAALHGLEWAHLPGAASVPTFTIAQQFALWSSYQHRYPLRTIGEATEWLGAASAQVTPQPFGLVHWDFHPENVLVDTDDQLWVIDWTQFQATDVRFDLAWTLVLLASQQSAESAEAVRVRYATLRGWDQRKSQDEMQFFEAAACAKRLVSVLVSIRYGADALGMRPGAETIMTSQLPRIEAVYRRWLALTGMPLIEMEELLAAHL